MAITTRLEAKMGLFGGAERTITPQGNQYDDPKGRKSDPNINWKVYE